MPASGFAVKSGPGHSHTITLENGMRLIAVQPPECITTVDGRRRLMWTLWEDKPQYMGRTNVVVLFGREFG